MLKFQDATGAIGHFHARTVWELPIRVGPVPWLQTGCRLCSARSSLAACCAPLQRAGRGADTVLFTLIHPCMHYRPDCATVPGCFSLNCAVRLVMAAFSDAVAKTVIEPSRVSAAVDGSVAGLGVEAQPARVSATAVSVTRVDLL